MPNHTLSGFLCPFDVGPGSQRASISDRWRYRTSRTQMRSSFAFICPSSCSTRRIRSSAFFSSLFACNVWCAKISSCRLANDGEDENGSQIVYIVLFCLLERCSKLFGAFLIDGAFFGRSRQFLCEKSDLHFQIDFLFLDRIDLGLQRRPACANRDSSMANRTNPLATLFLL